MSTLRWTLGLITAIVAAGFIALSVIGGGFRRSFGASDNTPIQLFVIAVVTILILASLVWPDQRVLMHIVAVLMAALCVICVVIARETITTATLGLLYAAGWLTFYYRTVWAAATP